MNRELEQFFTSESVSRLLATSLAGVRPRIAIDVGAGAGALLKAVQQRWKGTRLVGVDVDQTLCHESLEGCVRLFRDGLDHELPAFLRKTYGHIDLAVSNPPYTALTRSGDTDIILREAGLLSAVKKSKKYPAELIFLAQNLRILREDGCLAIIMPSGIVSADRWRQLRHLLCSNNRLKMVIELPDNAFMQTEAKTFVLIMQKGGRTKQVSLRRAAEDGTLTETTRLTVAEATERMDWSYYDWREQCRASEVFCLRELGANIFRGRFSAAEAQRRNLPVFHTRDMDNIFSRVCFKGDIDTDLHSVAKKGDILVARVGSRCLGRMAFVEAGESLISDCIYVVRVPLRIRHAVWQAMTSPETIKSIHSLSRGVCARYITKDQILDLPLFR